MKQLPQPAYNPFQSEYDDCSRIIATAVLAIVHKLLLLLLLGFLPSMVCMLESFGLFHLSNISHNQTYSLLDKEPLLIKT